jgi:hypothetical protein
MSEKIVPAGDFVDIEWDADLNGSETVAISVVADENSKLTDIRIVVGFAGEGEWYALTDMIECKNFFFWDHGGASVPVYGPFMRIIVDNKGTTPVKIKQTGRIRG